MKMKRETKVKILNTIGITLISIAIISVFAIVIYSFSTRIYPTNVVIITLITWLIGVLLIFNSQRIIK